MNPASKRNYGIDMLRLVLIYMVCLLHTLRQGGLLDAGIADTGEYYVFWLLEALAFCAVDGFALISGYMSSDRPFHFSKIIGLWLQAFFYSFVLTVFFAACGLYRIPDVQTLVKLALPVTFEQFWYFTAYFAAFFFMPIVNKAVAAMEVQTAKRLFLLFILLFSVIECCFYTFKMHSGYAAVWLIVLYCIGAFARKIDLFAAKKSGVLILLFALCIGISFGAFAIFDTEKLLNYVSPTIVAAALLLVILFSRIPQLGKVSGALSPLAFGIYLYQQNPVIWDALDGVAARVLPLDKPPLAILLVFVFALGIFVCGAAIEFLRALLFRLFHLEKLVAAVDRLLKKVIDRLSPLLK